MFLFKRIFVVLLGVLGTLCLDADPAHGLRGCLVSKIYDKSRDKFHAKERTYGEWFIPVI